MSQEPDRFQQILHCAWMLYRLQELRKEYAAQLEAQLPKQNDHNQVSRAVVAED